MKKVRYSVSVELQLKESIDQLVERGYFSEEDYAVSYIRDLVTYFQLNLDHLTAFVAPEYFNRYGTLSIARAIELLGMHFSQRHQTH